MLWLVISGGLFLALASVWLLTDRIARDTLGRIGNDLVYLAIGCAVAGWVAQAVLVMCGVRLAGRPAPAEAPDYDDALPHRSPAALENPPPSPSGPDEFP